MLARHIHPRASSFMKMPVAKYNMRCQKARWRDRTAVVTGAAWGIGRAIVHEMVKNQIMTVGLDIRKDRMDELLACLPKKRQSYFQPMKCDVRIRKEVDKSFNCICENYGGVDILVNNAGILETGQIVTLDPAMQQKVMDVNVMGLIYCTQRAYKSMSERNFDGHIINVCSIVGHTVPTFPPDEIADLNIYPPSKFAVKAISETLRQELRGLKKNIKITNISPGVTETEILSKSLSNLGKALKPNDIAAGVMYALFTPEHCNVFEVTIKPVGESI